jgi:hypothetical protein
MINYVRRQVGWALVLLIVSALGCAPTSPTPRTVAFNETEFTAYGRTGTAQFVGQAFWKQGGGGVVYAAGEVVKLIPANGYTSEWWQKQFLEGKKLESASPEVAARIASYERSTMADGTGNFEFSGLPAGDYYVITQKTWYVASYGTQGGPFGMKVSILPGERKKVVVSP